MEATEYLRQRARMCGECDLCEEGCGFFDHVQDCRRGEIETVNPELAVEIVQRWAEAHPVEGGINLTAMERRFVQIYIEKGYIWAAREKSGYLVLFKRCPERINDGFVDTAPRHGSRGVLGDLLLSVTWENSPVLLPKLLEG